MLVPLFISPILSSDRYHETEADLCQPTDDRHQWSAVPALVDTMIGWYLHSMTGDQAVGLRHAAETASVELRHHHRG